MSANLIRELADFSIVYSYLLETFFGFTLYMVFAWIFNLQMIIHLPMLMISFPAIVMNTFDIWFPIVQYDVLEQLGLLKLIFPHSEHDAERFPELHP